MKRRTGSVRLWAAAFWLLVWEGASLALAATTGGRMLLLASPVQALGRLLALAGTAAFWQAVAFSSLRILGGFLLACALAAVLAPLAARFQWIRDLLSPLVAVVKAVPVVSFIILALIFFSSENLSLLISALMVFPPVYLNVLEGIGHTDRQLLEMARVFRVPSPGSCGASTCRRCCPISAPPCHWGWACAGSPARRRRSSACLPGLSARRCTPPRCTSRPETSSPGRR